MGIEKYNPKKKPKYNGFIFRFLKNKIKRVELFGFYPRIVKFKNGYGWYIGWFIDGDFIGSRICYGSEKVEVFCYIHLFEEEITEEIKWEEYERVGTCALTDLRHRWIYANRNSRKCKYCGKWERKAVKTVKKIERFELWEEM